ncbi:PEP-CTERM sorting domain-containing protein [Colwellia sp. MB02u-14]|nr:PEP-CTERM sorting domain-containing protein [Colwellia sp. MB02u-14]
MTWTWGEASTKEYLDVPEPSTLAIFALGMIGLVSRRFKKQS